MTIEDIQARDPAFDRTSFLSRAEAVQSLVQRARAEGRPGLARPGVSDDMASRLGAELEQQRAAGQKQVADARIKSASIVDATADPHRDTIQVRFQLEGVSYLAGGGKPVGGQVDRRRTWAEDWWFQRPAGTTTAIATAVDLEHCLGCGAPANPTPEGRCAYCARPLADPRTWVVARITDAQAGVSVFDLIQAASAGVPMAGTQVVISPAVSSGARKVAGLVFAVIMVVVIGAVVAAVLAAKQGADSFSDAVKSATGDISAPAGGQLPPGVTFPAGVKPAATTVPKGYVTPVGNPKVKAPVNDLSSAVAALKQKVGRPLVVTGIHLYEDGRINFEVQAPDDPASTDNWTWKFGQLGEPSQGSSNLRPDRFFPLEGVNLANLEQICNAALGQTGIVDGFIDHPYLVTLGRGDVRWYIPVTSESRKSNTKTYRVSLDGKKSDVF